MTIKIIFIAPQPRCRGKDYYAASYKLIEKENKKLISTLWYFMPEHAGENFCEWMKNTYTFIYTTPSYASLMKMKSQFMYTRAALTHIHGVFAMPLIIHIMTKKRWWCSLSRHKKGEENLMRKLSVCVVYVRFLCAVCSVFLLSCTRIYDGMWRTCNTTKSADT